MSAQPKKRLPAYGKELMQVRMSGGVPKNGCGNGMVVVTYGWNWGKCFKRVVLDKGVPPAQYEFRFLAGLDVMVVFEGVDEGRLLGDLIQEILSVKPRWLATCDMAGSRVNILKRL
ncbi:MAG TPA: hypothetical protein VK149_13345 [Sideroxyarcus sp.]|nr:hypothetical protein [Sideroxyarcus sp.]